LAKQKEDTCETLKRYDKELKSHWRFLFNTHICSTDWFI